MSSVKFCFLTMVVTKSWLWFLVCSGLSVIGWSVSLSIISYKCDGQGVLDL